MGFESARQARCLWLQRTFVTRICKELYLVTFKERPFFRKLPGLFVGPGKVPSFNLCRLHIGLIEWIDANDRAGDRSRHLPAEEFLPELHWIMHNDAHHRP